MQLFGRSFSLKFYDKNNRIIKEINDTFGANDPNWGMMFHVNQKIGLINEIAEFHIFNLSFATREELTGSSYVVFSAGYGTELKFCFQGQIMNIFDNRDQPDYVYSIYCLDYIEKQDPLNLIIPTTYTAQEAIMKIASTVPGLMVSPVNIEGLPDGPLQKSISFINTTYIQAYQKLAALLNINIWISNHSVFTSSKDYTPGNNSKEIILNYLNGMIGSPVFDVANAGVNVKSLLNCSLIPGNSVRVQTISPVVQLGAVNYAKFKQSDLTNGSWQIMEIDHIGNTRGQEWYSVVQGYSYQTDLKAIGSGGN